MRVGAVWGDVCGGRVWICVRCAHVWVCMCVAGVVCIVWFVVCVGGTGVHVYMCHVQGCEHMFMYGVWSCGVYGYVCMAMWRYVVCVCTYGVCTCMC